MPKSVKVSSFIASPAERYEILVDFTKTGKTSLITEIYGGDTFTTLDINVSGKKGTFYKHPAEFDYTPVEYDTEKNIKRTFRMETRGMGMMNIPHSFHVHD